MNERQQKVDRYVKHNGGYFETHEILIKLHEEIGELSSAMLSSIRNKKRPGENRHPENVREELGDVQFTLLALANSLEIDADDALDETIKKYRKRDGKKRK